MSPLKSLLQNAFLLSFVAPLTSAATVAVNYGSGDPGNGGATDPLAYNANQCDSYSTFSHIVKNATGPVLLDDDDYTTQTSQKGLAVTGAITLTSANAERATGDGVRNTNHEMEIYDAYYNGTVVITLEPDSNNKTTASCANFTSQPIVDAYLRIGPQSRNGVSRSSYDYNDFYLSIGRTFKANECPVTENKVFFGLESSSGLTYDGVAWDVNTTKTNNGFSMSGTAPSRQAHYNNYYNYQVNTTDDGFVKSPNKCPNWFYAEALTSLYQPILRGSIDGTVAKLTWSFVDYRFGYKVTAVFSGTAWSESAKLDMSANVISTTGETKRTSSHAASDKIKYIVIAVVLVVAIIFAGVGWKVWQCAKRRRQVDAAEKATSNRRWPMARREWVKL